MEIKDIEKLAKLARIDLTEKEKEAYLKDVSAILGYVDQIKAVVGQAGEERTPLRQGFAGLKNVMRADENVTASGTNTVVIIGEFPDRKGDYLKVKKIL